MIDKIFHTQWHLMRWVRLVVGVSAIVNFIYEFQKNSMQTVDYFILAAGFYFIYKGLFNTGCEVVPKKFAEDEFIEDEIVEYTEIK